MHACCREYLLGSVMYGEKKWEASFRGWRLACQLAQWVAHPSYDQLSGREVTQSDTSLWLAGRSDEIVAQARWTVYEMLQFYLPEERVSPADVRL